ncbi:MAG: GNAT family N-acetyltransferase [Candidatus Hodarchaeales archaeon]
MIRDYQTSDYPDLLEISKHVWNGEDYLPQRIVDYEEDPCSHPMVIVERDRVISIANLRFLNSKIVWLESIRSHPDIRGKGYGTKLTKAMLRKAKSLGAEEAWLLSNVENLAAQRIIEKMDFSEMVRLYMWPDWEIMNASLKRLNIENPHVSNQLKSKHAFTAEKLLKKMSPYADLVNSLTLSAKEIVAKWKKCQSEDVAANVLSSIVKAGGIRVIIGEFIVYPPDARLVEKMIKEGSVYCLENPPALVTIQKSGEIVGGMGIGLNTNSLVALESLLYFINEKWPELIYWLFYPSCLEHPKIKPGFHLQGVMRKELY